MQQQQQQQDNLRGMMPSLMRSSYDHRHSSSIINDDFAIVNNHMEQPNSILSYASSTRQSQHQNTHHYNDQDQYPSYDEFDAIVQDYLQNLSSKKRDKALIDQARYAMILQVLKDPRNTTVSTAQFRFWVKKMFQLTSNSGQRVYHDGKPVAMREDIYGILVRAHREAHHGGRDKTSALVSLSIDNNQTNTNAICIGSQTILLDSKGAHCSICSTLSFLYLSKKRKSTKSLISWHFLTGYTTYICNDIRRQSTKSTFHDCFEFISIFKRILSRRDDANGSSSS